MEMNQRLFDECAKGYKQLVDREEERSENRVVQWQNVYKMALNNPHSPNFLSGDMYLQENYPHVAHKLSVLKNSSQDVASVDLQELREEIRVSTTGDGTVTGGGGGKDAGGDGGQQPQRRKSVYQDAAVRDALQGHQHPDPHLQPAPETS